MTIGGAGQFNNSEAISPRTAPSGGQPARDASRSADGSFAAGMNEALNDDSESTPSVAMRRQQSKSLPDRKNGSGANAGSASASVSAAATPTDGAVPPGVPVDGSRTSMVVLSAPWLIASGPSLQMVAADPKLNPTEAADSQGTDGSPQSPLDQAPALDRAAAAPAAALPLPSLLVGLEERGGLVTDSAVSMPPVRTDAGEQAVPSLPNSVTVPAVSMETLPTANTSTNPPLAPLQGTGANSAPLGATAVTPDWSRLPGVPENSTRSGLKDLAFAARITDSDRRTVTPSLLLADAGSAPVEPAAGASLSDEAIRAGQSMKNVSADLPEFGEPSQQAKVESPRTGLVPPTAQIPATPQVGSTTSPNSREKTETPRAELLPSEAPRPEPQSEESRETVRPQAALSGGANVILSPNSSALTGQARSAAPPAPTAQPARAESPAKLPGDPSSGSPEKTVREITVRIAGDTAQSADVRLVSRNGEVQVTVKTSDGSLANTLRGDLSKLVDRITQADARVDIWNPGPTAAGSTSQTGSQGRDKQGDDSNPAFFQYGQDRGESKEQGSERHHRQAPEWLDEIDDASQHQLTRSRLK